MNTVRELHDEAMRLSQLAYVAREKGEYALAKDLAAEAFVCEERAAGMVPDGPRSEPTRSILYRSAASLAYQSKQLVEARRMIALGLSGSPPPQIQHELDELYQQIHFEMALAEESLVVEDEQIDMHLIGDYVGFGAVLYDTFVDRLQALKQLVTRTIQRLSGRSFQSSGRVADSYKTFIPYVQLAPKSFVITLRLARADRSQMSYLFSAADVVGQIMDGMDLISEGREAELRSRYNNDAYYQNFVSLTRSRIAPDGQQIQLVQFNAVGKKVNLTRTSADIPAPIITAGHEDKVREVSITVCGILDFAESRKKANLLGLTTSEGKEYDVAVDQGLDDLVLSYWKQYVAVSGILSDNKRIRLTDIAAAEPPDDTTT